MIGMRLLFLQRVIMSALLLLWVGLLHHQVVEGAYYRQKADKNRIRLVPLPASRGAVVDRHGIPLVEDQMSFELAVFPQEVDSPSLLWRQLAPIVERSTEELARAYRRGYQAPFAPVTLVHNLPPATAFLLEEKKSELPGTLVRPIPKRRYLLGASLGPVMGYLGLISEKELTRLKPYGYTIRDYVGKDGLEQMYDPYLRGHSGGLQVEVDHRGRMVRQMGYLPPQRGRQVRVSLDGRLQQFCHQLLAEQKGAIIIMEPRSGEILALVSAPTFDPNAFLDFSRRQEVRNYLRSRERPMFNRAIRSAVPPGSTFKVAVASEALQEGKITGGTHFECGGEFKLGRSVFRCWWDPGHGPQDVIRALEHSCNVFFYNTGRRLGPEGIGHAAESFGFGQKTKIDLPREGIGFIPNPSWMKTAHQQPWQEGDTLSFAIGQSALTATPIQILQLFTAIAMEGRIPQPHLVLEIEGERKGKAYEVRQLEFKKEVLERVKAGMERVVSSDSGTGRLAQLPGIPAAGKTGTAQSGKGQSHAWFAGYSPPRDPKVSFVVFLEHGGRGGAEAALLVRDMLVYLHELGYV